MNMVSMQHQPTRTHIRWTPDEQRRVIDDAAFHLRGMLHMIPQSDDTVGCQLFFSQLRAAQHRQLPPDRRRKLVGRQELSESFIADLARRLKDPPKEQPEHYPWHPDKQPGLVRLQIPDTRSSANGHSHAHAPTAESSNSQQSISTEVPKVPELSAPVAPTEPKLVEAVEPPKTVEVGLGQMRVELSSASDVDIFAEALKRMLGVASAVTEMKKLLPTQEQLAMLADLHEMQKLLVDETGKITSSVAQLTERMKALEGDVTKLEKAHEERPTDRLIPRVAILGCRKYEVEHIRQGCEAIGLKIDFRHYDQDESPRKIHADWAISLKWLSHSWDNQIKDAIPAGKYVFLNGGVGMAVNQLKTWFQT